MSEQVFTWITPIWLAILLFLVGWIAVGIIASVLLKRGHILAALPAAAFGFGGYIVVRVQILETSLPTSVVSVLPVLSGLFCILVLFAAYGKRSSKGVEK